MDWIKNNFTNWTSKNKRIDNFIQVMQLSVNDYKDVIFEWIPYHMFNDIKELNNAIYLAVWKEGPLYWNGKNYTKNLANKTVALKYLINQKNITNEFLNEVCKFL